MAIKHTKKKLTTYIIDIEVFSNYFLLVYYNTTTKKYGKIEIKGSHKSISNTDRMMLINILIASNTVGFNSMSYDLPILIFAMLGSTCWTMKYESDRIIGNKSGFIRYNKDVTRHFFEILPHHYDVSKVLLRPKTSLKILSVRMKTELVDTFVFTDKIKDKDIDTCIKYCKNDVKVTNELFESQKHKILFRYLYERKNKVDRSNLHLKTDSGLCEHVMCHRLGWQYSTFKNIVEENKDKGARFVKYVNHEYIKFKDQRLNDFKEALSKESIYYTGKKFRANKVVNTKLYVNNNSVNFGLGGLHSNYPPMLLKDEDIWHVDVRSYYPNLILKHKISPIGFTGEQRELFLKEYRLVFQDRSKAKDKKDFTESDMLKLVLNIMSGKMLSIYSAFFNPTGYLDMTLNGQFGLIMLMEKIANSGSTIINANTDGLLLICNNEDKLKSIMEEWENETGFYLDKEPFRHAAIRDINNYMVVRKDGTTKTKGAFCLNSLDHNPNAEIIIKAVKAFMLDNKPIVETVYESNNIHDFTYCLAAAGSLICYQGKPIGKVARWVIGDTRDALTYQSGSLVPNGGNAILCNELQSIQKVQKNHYLREAEKLMKVLTSSSKQIRMF